MSTLQDIINTSTEPETATEKYILRSREYQRQLLEAYGHELDATNTKQEGSAHYTQMNIQPWDVIDTWPIEQQIGYHRGNVLKYTMRMGSKDGRLQEAKKIRHYADKLIEVLERSNGSDTGSKGQK